MRMRRNSDILQSCSAHDNVERFSLGGAADEPPRAAAGAGGRAGERKTLYVITLSPTAPLLAVV